MLRGIFGLKIPKKGPKNAKKWFFSHIGQTMCHTIMKFCMPGLDLNQRCMAACSPGTSQPIPSTTGHLGTTDNFVHCAKKVTRKTIK